MEPLPLATAESMLQTPERKHTVTVTPPQPSIFSRDSHFSLISMESESEEIPRNSEINVDSELVTSELNTARTSRSDVDLELGRYDTYIQDSRQRSQSALTQQSSITDVDMRLREDSVGVDSVDFECQRDRALTFLSAPLPVTQSSPAPEPARKSVFVRLHEHDTKASKPKRKRRRRKRKRRTKSSQKPSKISMPVKDDSIRESSNFNWSQAATEDAKKALSRQASTNSSSAELADFDKQIQTLKRVLQRVHKQRDIAHHKHGWDSAEIKKLNARAARIEKKIAVISLRRYTVSSRASSPRKLQLVSA